MDSNDSTPSASVQVQSSKRRSTSRRHIIHRQQPSAPSLSQPSSDSHRTNVLRLFREPLVYRESMLLWMILVAILICLIVLGPFYFLIFVALFLYFLHDFLS